MNRFKSLTKKYSDRLFSIVLIIMAGAVILLHAMRLRFNVFWVDTAFSADLIRLPFTEMLEATSVNEHPPFYYIFGKMIIALFNDHPWSFRATAFIPFLGIIILALTYIRREFGYSAAFIMVAFSSFTPASVTYVMETRMYELGCLLVLISMLCLYCIFLKSSGNRRLYFAVFGIFSVLTAYTHYYLTVTVCVMYVSLILYCFIYNTDKKKCIIVSVAAILSYLPWLGIMLRNFGVRAGDWWATDYAGFDETMKELYGLKRFYIPALFVITVTVIKLYMEKRKKKDKSFSLSASEKLWFVMTGVAMILSTFLVGVIASEMIRPLFLSRYIYPLASSAWLLFGISIKETVGLGVRSKRLTSAFSGALSLVLSLFLIYTVFGEYRANLAAQSEASADTVNSMNMISIPEGSTIYSDFEQEEFTIAGYYFPGTTVIPENAAFYYSVPAEDEFYLVFKAGSVAAAAENLQKAGYETMLLAENVTLGFQGDLTILFCEKY